MYNRVLRNPIHPVIRRVQSVAAAALDGVGAALHQNHCRNRSLSKDWAFCRSWCAPSSTRRCGPSESSTWGMSTVTGPTRARTVNGLERLNREIRRRTRVAVLYPQRGFPPGPGNGDCQGGQRGVADRPTLSPSAPTPPHIPTAAPLPVRAHCRPPVGVRLAQFPRLARGASYSPGAACPVAGRSCAAGDGTASAARALRPQTQPPVPWPE